MIYHQIFFVKHRNQKHNKIKNFTLNQVKKLKIILLPSKNLLMGVQLNCFMITPAVENVLKLFKLACLSVEQL